MTSSIMKLNKLCLTFLALSLCACLNARPDEVDMMKWKWEGRVEKSTEEVKEGVFSYRWDAGKAGGFKAIALENDWTKYKVLHFWAYSETATGTKVAVSACPTNSPPGNHYIYLIPVDWTGWKEFNISIKEFSINRKPKGWGDIETVEFISHFYGTPEPGTLLFINDLKLVD